MTKNKSGRISDKDLASGKWLGTVDRKKKIPADLDWSDVVADGERMFWETVENPYPGHFHVGHNIPGYLPESDVVCFDDLDNALSFLASELNDLSGDWSELGVEPSEDDPWTSIADDVYSDYVHIHDGDAKPHAIRDQGLSFMYVPPEGADLHYWLHFMQEPQDQCELAEED